MDLHIHRPVRSLPLAVDIYDKRTEREFVQHVTPVRMPVPATRLATSADRDVVVAQMIRP